MKLKDFFTDESRWWKGDFNGPSGAHCLSGAILSLDIKGDLDGHIYKKLLKELVKRNPERFKDDCTSVCVWNDHPATTFAEVKDVLKYLDI